VNEIIDKFPSIAEDSKLNNIHIPEHIQKFPVDVKKEIVNILRLIVQYFLQCTDIPQAL
jgi:hypothetical protein